MGAAVAGFCVAALATLVHSCVCVPGVAMGGGQELQDIRCTPLNRGPKHNQSYSRCFCYRPEWSPDLLWSAIRIQVQSTEAVTVSLKLDCAEPENALDHLTCFLRDLWKPANSTEAHLDVSSLYKDFCFNVDVITEPSVYQVTFKKIWFNPSILAVSGVLLFYFAGRLSRSSAVFYAAGVTLGVTASLLFLLLILKRLISKHSTFLLLLGTCVFLTAYSVHFLMENMTWIWTENKHYVLGYFMAAGTLSSAACYAHGPPRSEWSLTLLAWTLQILACTLIYCGLALPEIALAVIAVLFSVKVLCYPVTALCYLYRIMTRKKPVFKFLTEEEYKERSEEETSKALGELRDFCSGPQFNSWLTVSRLSSPKRFADFVLGSSHVTPEEARVHEEQFGLGSLFLEEQLFALDREAEQNHLEDVIHVDDEFIEEDHFLDSSQSDSERNIQR
ncbi:nuclear envelope integral membrane protein 2-like [Pseudophryne corroboree]|uniref:nuclear envelope integral membrane protein 2-like n=1 Tax=Pseudophryne corroboree TaxID=495146 RepID=UPI00308120E1